MELSWKRTRRKRLNIDHNTCQRCGKHFNWGRGLTVHHIISRDRGGSDDISNLISLCVKCHDEVEGLGLNRWEIRAGLGEEDETIPDWKRAVYGAGIGVCTGCLARDIHIQNLVRELEFIKMEIPTLKNVKGDLLIYIERIKNLEMMNQQLRDEVQFTSIFGNKHASGLIMDLRARNLTLRKKYKNLKRKIRSLERKLSTKGGCCEQVSSCYEEVG